MAIEESALNREVVMKLIGGPKATVEIDTASNSTVETDTDISAMTSGNTWRPNRSHQGNIATLTL